MRNSTKKFVIQLFAIVLILFGGNLLNAQEIIEIPTGIDGQGKPTLFNAIMGDTTDTGDRAHPNAIYRLTRGQIYPSEGMFIGFDFTLDAAEGSERPPMIVPFADVQGNLPYALISAKDSNRMTFKNILFSAINNPAQRQLGQNGVVTKSGRTTFDNCVFNGFTGGGITGMNSIGYNLHVSNCIFRNIQSATAWWEGDPIMFWAARGDTMIIEKSTFFNCGGHIVNSNWENFYTDYFKFDRNTVYGGNFNVLTSMSQTNSQITNNLFLNTYAMGIDTSGQSAGWVVPVKEETACIVPFGVNDATKMLEELDLVEADRHLEVHNNAYFWSQEVKDYWDSRGNQFPETDPQFMNDETKAFFADDTNYPLLAESNNIEEDPNMEDGDMETEVIAGFAKYGNGLYDSFLEGGPSFDGYLHHYPGGDGVDDVFFFVEWPLAENLTYTSETLLHHNSNGGPVGDPRWVDVTAINNIDKASDIEISNYPNPFSVSTTIKYRIEKTANVKLSVFNIMGKEVAVLVNEKMQEGSYSVEWNGTTMSGSTVPSGIYFYNLQNGTESITKRMIKTN